MAKEYLDKDGLLYFWQKIKNSFALKSHTHTKSQITDFPTIPGASSTSPKMNGTAAVGSETAYARGDHVHPSDTSRVPTTRTVNGYALSANVNIGAEDIDSIGIATGGNHLTLADDLDALNTGKVDTETGKGLSTNDYTTAEKTKLSGIATGAEVNQNAFSNVVVGSTTIAADGKTDTLTLVAGSNVTLTPDATNNKVTIAATNTTYSDATTSTHGLMTAGDKTKLNKLVFDSSNKIDSSILPSYVDDVIEAYARSGQTALSSTWLATGSATGTVITPETGKIYVLMADSGDYAANTQFRWSGTAYVKLADGGVSSITNAEIDTIVAS